jgi:ABC-type glycerol-3-phosphate transport system substrate-binding protein
MKGSETISIPTTWKEVIEEGKKLTTDTDGDGMIDRYAMIFWQNGFESSAPFLWALNGQLFNEDGSGINLTSEEMYQAVDFIRALIYAHKIMPHDWTNFEGGQAFLKDNPNYSFPIDALKYSQPLPNHREFYKINQMITEMLKKIILTDADIMTELEKTEKAINSAIEQ